MYHTQMIRDLNVHVGSRNNVNFKFDDQTLGCAIL